jgi:hypothetical protein
MEVVVSSEQIRRIGFNILDKIYGPLKRFWGDYYTEVFVDRNFNPRMGFYNSILSPRAIFILKEDYLKFKSVIPLEEKEFAEIFASWLDMNYSIKDITKLATTKPNFLGYRGAIERGN